MSKNTGGGGGKGFLTMSKSKQIFFRDSFPKFYFLGDFLDIQCPHMTKAFFLFFKENVLNFIFIAFKLLHFITTL